MMMVVGVFVHFTVALSVEDVQKRMLYYISEKAVKEYILVYLPVIELAFLCMIYSFTFHLASSSTYLYCSSLQNRHKISILVCLYLSCSMSTGKVNKRLLFPNPPPQLCQWTLIIADN